MLGALAKRLFGSANERFLKGLDLDVAAIGALEPELEALDDAGLRARTDAFRQRLTAGESLDDLLVEAFATVREAAKRTLGQRHFDVQMMGGIVLHRGMISEMKTGEGKATPSGWARFTGSWAWRSAASCTAWTTPSGARPMAAT